MKITNTTCPTKDGKQDATKCHSNLLSTLPTLISIVHTPSEHILIEQLDYNTNGTIKKSSFNTILSQLKIKSNQNILNDTQ